jgi:hypothetical protein
MMRTLIAMISLLVTVPFCHAACEKAVAGDTIRWAALVCELRNETDDLEAAQVQTCLNALIVKDKIPTSPAEICSLNKKYKLELCKNAVKYGSEKSAQACVRSKVNIRKEVMNGFGGPD